MPHRRRNALAAVLLAGSLAGCDTVGSTGPVARLDVRAAIARGEMRSPRPATVAISSIEGAPEAVVARLRQDFVAEAAGRDIALAEAPQARYFVRGYLDATPGETGTAVHYVWDVFDSAKQRNRRIDDGFEVPGQPGADPWSGVDDAALGTMASRSADDLAMFLSGVPEAAAAPGVVAAAASAPAKPVN